MLNFAIIGCGAIASRHALQAAAVGKLWAVCDIVEEKANSLAAQYQAKAYPYIEDLLQAARATPGNSTDVVVICTPNGLHAEHTILALRAGFHVICEKPMAIHSKDCENMIAAAAKAGKHLFVVKQNRFNPPVAAVRKMLDEGRLGRIYSVQVNCCWHRGAAYYQDSWHGTQDMDGGILYTQFSHFIDLLYWMVGDLKEVVAFTGNFRKGDDIAFGDTGVACLRFENGALGSLHFTVNSFRKNMEGSLTIVAEKGTVKIGGQYLNKLEYQQLEDGIVAEPPPGNSSNDYGDYQGSMSNHDKVYGHVLEVIVKGSPNQFSAQNGLKTVEIIEKIYSAANGS
ncbi:MAG TPA: Gfo/Idh/MocA family oxidoreductase [Puia sp.]|nr:Gfo/Idh/MocA family oxidoreductase [Puia sp.]